MNFLSPAALFLFGIAAPIIALYILKLRRRREPVSTLMFWEQIFREKQTTSLFQKLKYLLSLLLQLLFLTLIVLAIARPQFGFMTKLAHQIVLIIDHSASMNTREATLSRLESAKQRVLKLVDNLRFIDEMMAISCDTQPIIHSPFTNHQKSLRAAIASIQPTVVKTDLAPALSLAYSVTQTNTNPEIVVLSDFAIGAQSQQVAEMLQNPPPHAKLHLFPAADKVSDNVGITKFRVRKSLVNAFDYQTL